MKWNTGVRRSVFLKVNGKDVSLSRTKISICKNFLELFQTSIVFIGGLVGTFSDQKDYAWRPKQQNYSC